MKPRIIFTLVTLLMGLQATAQEKYMPLETRFNHDAKIYDDTLFMATEKGLYAYPLEADNPSWEVYGFDGMEIGSFVKSGSKIFATRFVAQVVEDRPFYHPYIGTVSLLFSTDGGKTYTDATPDDMVTYDDYASSSLGGLVNFLQRPDNLDYISIVYAVNTRDILSYDYDGKVVESADFGTHWNAKPQRVPLRSRFVLTSDPRNEVLLYGLKNDPASFSSYIAETKDNFQTLTNVSFNIDINSAFMSIVRCPTNSHALLGATFTGVAKSEDGGLSWKHTLRWRSQGYQKVLYDPSDPQVAYAFCQEMSDWNIYQITVYRSSDGGNTWGQIFMKIVYGTPTYMMLHEGKLYFVCNDYDYPGDFFSIPAGAPATSVRHLTEDSQPSTNRVYDLGGRPANTSLTNKGIYIRNGKKYINF